MEVSGITSTNPSEVGDDSFEYSNPIGGNSSILEYLKKSTEKQSELFDVIRNNNNSLIKEQKKNTQQLNLNTQAISDLTRTLNNITLEVELKGLDSKLFRAMDRLSKKKKGAYTIEKFGDAYTSTVKKIADLSGYTKKIDQVTESVMGAFGTVKELGKGLLLFSGGLALLGFTLITFMDSITLEDMATFAAIMGIVWGASELIDNASWDFAKAALGIATLGLAIWGFTEVVDSETAWDFVKSITLISAGMAILSKVSGSVGKNVSGILKGAASIAAIAGSVWLLNKAVSDFDDIDLVKTGKMVLVTAGLGAVWWGMGKFFTSIIKGSVAALAIGASLWVLGEGVQQLNKIDMTLERGLALAGITVAAAGILTIIGNPATIGFTLAGAAATALIGGALWALSEGMQALTEVDVSESQAENFGNSIVNVVDALSYLGNPIRLVQIAASVPASLAVAGATTALTAAMVALDKMPQLSDEKSENFSNTLENLVGVYSDLGLWGLAKATAASAVVSVISGATILSAGAIWAFTKISSSPEAVDNAVLSLDKFITGVSGTMKKNQDKFSSIADGIQSFMGLSTMVSEIADSVQRISNMEFLEKEVRNGKVVVTGVRTFKPKDFENVGESIGKILSTLTEPLAKIGNQKDSYSIAGFKVTNPFSNKVQEGIEAMANIGSVFTPLVNVLDVFNKYDIGDTKIKKFNENISSILGGIGDAFQNHGVELDDDMLESMSNASGLVSNLVGFVGNENFAKNSKSFGKMSDNVVSIKDSLKGMDLEKLSKFNDLIFNMNKMGENDVMDDFVEAFKEFLEKLVDIDNNRNNTTQTTPTNGQQNNRPMVYTNPQRSSADNSENQISGEDMKNIISESNGDVISILERIHSFLQSGDLEVNHKDSLMNI